MTMGTHDGFESTWMSFFERPRGMRAGLVFLLRTQVSKASVEVSSLDRATPATDAKRRIVVL